MKTAIICVCLTAVFCLAGDDAESLYSQGLDALRAGDNVAAAKALAKALDAAEAAKNDELATQIGSCLFWARKKLNVNDIAKLQQADSKAAEKAEAIITKKVEPNDAEKALERASSYASSHQDDQLLVAIAYFEVAQRYRGTDAGFKATDLTLSAMTKAKSEPAKKAVVNAKPAQAPAKNGGVKLVVWNQHNGNGGNNHGTTELNAALYMNGNQVWEQQNVEIDWRPDEDCSVTIPLPAIAFDKVKIEITKFCGEGGGLSEIEVIKDGINYAKGCKATASGETDPTRCAAKVTDGITTSKDSRVGYWLLPIHTTGWVEVDLTRRTGK